MAKRETSIQESLSLYAKSLKPTLASPINSANRRLEHALFVLPALPAGSLKALRYIYSSSRAQCLN